MISNELWYLNLIYVIVIFDYARKTYGFNKNHLVNMVVFIAFYVINTFAKSYLDLYQSPITSIALDFIMINIFTFLFFKKRPEKIYYNTFFLIYLISIKFTFIMISNLIMAKMQINIDYTLYFISLFYLCTYNKVVQFFQKKHKTLKISESDAQDIFISALLYITTIHYFANNNTLFETIVYIFSMLLCVYRIYVCFKKQINKELEYREMILTELKSCIDVSSKLKEHEEMLENELINRFVRNYISSKNGWDEYLVKLLEKIKNLKIEDKSDNETINEIIAQAYFEEKIGNISFTKEIEKEIDWNFNNIDDIKMIIKGLIQNAINTDSTNKKVAIKIKKEGDFIKLEVAHNYDKKLEEIRLRDFPSNMREKINLLKELKIEMVTEVVKENKGEIEFLTSEDTYITKVSLPVNTM